MCVFPSRSSEGSPTGILMLCQTRRLMKIHSLGKLHKNASACLPDGCAMQRRHRGQKEPALSSNKTLTSRLRHTYYAVKSSSVFTRGTEHLATVVRLATHFPVWKPLRQTNRRHLRLPFLSVRPSPRGTHFLSGPRLPPRYEWTVFVKMKRK